MRDEEIDRQLKEAAQRNADAIADSSVFVALFNDAMKSDPIPLIQMGLAVYMDKPIVLLVPESTVIPDNLRRLAQRIEYFKRDPNDMSSLNSATDRLMFWLSAREG